MSLLFTPTNVGPYTLAHRVVLAPLTRMRSGPGDVPGDLMVEYYTQRSSPGGFMIAEATPVSVGGIVYAGAPGIYTDAQEEGWRRVTDAVHANGATIFLQLWHGGRQAHPVNMGGKQPIAPSAIRSHEKAIVKNQTGRWVEAEQVMPLALKIGEIAGVVEEFRQAAERAQRAGFDGVELHAANGYLPDQFLQDNSNTREDAYGGPVENRARFLLEVVEALISVWGGDRVAVRLAPSGTFGNMADSDPAATFGYVANVLNRFGLAYLHLIEPRIRGIEDVDPGTPVLAAEQLRKVFNGPIVAAGGFTAESAERILSAGHADLVAFGRHFVSNPDLPERLRLGSPLNPYDRSTFYGGDRRGYGDYPAASMEVSR
ncbi:alkene reductase [Sphingomonas nostoxanthinifaciens]|uniref:alkene reductase n=1 Tax=Sphingomonas nostoxanthinifaciens TaxID=2872652 RepID=UPI001CC1C498|nr:alkene reductase [Sphingomonas nostoxanthinifaciens]UAK25286.1 alkene reductase [Sphingomonas nostoxanthinifaciens]